MPRRIGHRPPPQVPAYNVGEDNQAKSIKSTSRALEDSAIGAFGGHSSAAINDSNKRIKIQLPQSPISYSFASAPADTKESAEMKFRSPTFLCDDVFALPLDDYAASAENVDVSGESLTPTQNAYSSRKGFEVGTKKYLIQPTIGDGNCAFNGFALSLIGLVSAGKLEKQAVKETLQLDDDSNIDALLGNTQKAQLNLSERLRKLAVKKLQEDDSYLESMQQAFSADLRELMHLIERADKAGDILEASVKKLVEAQGTNGIFNYQDSKIRQALIKSANSVLQGPPKSKPEENDSAQAINRYFEKMAEDKDWGGESELHALAKEFGIHLTTFSVPNNEAVRRIVSDEGKANAGYMPRAGWDANDIESLHRLDVIEGGQNNDKELYFKRLTIDQVKERFSSHKQEMEQITNKAKFNHIREKFENAYKQHYKYSEKPPVEMGMFLEGNHWSAVTNEQGFYDLNCSSSNHNLLLFANALSATDNTEIFKMKDGDHPNFA